MKKYIFLAVFVFSVIIGYSHGHSAEDRATIVTHTDSRIISWTSNPMFAGSIVGRPPGEYLGDYSGQHHVRQVIGYSTYVKNTTYDKLLTVTVGYTVSGRYFTKVITSHPGSESLVISWKDGDNSVGNFKIVGIVE